MTIKEKLEVEIPEIEDSDSQPEFRQRQFQDALVAFIDRVTSVHFNPPDADVIRFEIALQLLRGFEYEVRRKALAARLLPLIHP